MFLSVAQTPKNQTDSLFAKELLKKLYFYHSKEVVFPSMARTPLGKPYFVSTQPSLPHPWHFNLSHSKGWVAVALGAEPVGVDLQVFRPVSQSLTARVCSPTELQWLSSLPPDEIQKGFAFLWSGKEALCKESGEGIGTGRTLSTLSLEPRDKKPKTPSVPLKEVSHPSPTSTLSRFTTPHFALAVSRKKNLLL